MFHERKVRVRNLVRNLMYLTPIPVMALSTKDSPSFLNLEPKKKVTAKGLLTRAYLFDLRRNRRFYRDKSMQIRYIPLDTKASLHLCCPFTHNSGQHVAIIILVIVFLACMKAGILSVRSMAQSMLREGM